MLAVAYGSAAPQLGVAEFAPAARRVVEPPPTTGGDDSDPGRARDRNRQASTTTLAPTASSAPVTGDANAPTTRVGRARPCYGEPPRQLEDPTSPACLPTIFEGDNGGATARGVSSTEIRVAVPGVSTAASLDSISALFEYFNQRFELYGRRLVPVFSPGGANSTLEARTKAADLAAQGIFAAITSAQEWNTGAQAAMPIELARQNIVTVVRGGGALWSDRTLYDPWHPYVWSVFPSAEDIQLNLADLACTALTGGLAVHAGDANLRTTARRIGVVALGYDNVPSSQATIDHLSSCSDTTPLKTEWASARNGTAVLRTGFEQLRAAGATTLLCV